RRRSLRKEEHAVPQTCLNSQTRPQEKHVEPKVSNLHASLPCSRGALEKSALHEKNSQSTHSDPGQCAQRPVEVRNQWSLKPVAPEEPKQPSRQYEHPADIAE